MWAQKNYHFRKSFLDMNNKYYGTNLFFVDFFHHTEAARKEINNWIELQTNLKIRELIKPGIISNSTVLVLCNAIYFKGEWFSKFERKNTILRDFYVSSDSLKKVLTMHQTENFRFKQFDNFSALELPYKSNDLSMILFLPLEIDGMKKFEDSLFSDSIRFWINELMDTDKKEIDVYLPKFKVTSEFYLKKILQNMGMVDAFSLPPANFAGMTGSKDLCISKVVHQAYVDVYEEGTEAAAATAVFMDGEYNEPDRFRADHPFIFFIRENQTGSILFMGRIVDPME